MSPTAGEHFAMLGGCQVLPPADETYPEGRARVIEVYERLLQWHGGRAETILIVGHEFAGGRLVELLLNLEPDGHVHHSNTGLTYLVEEDRRVFQLKFANRI